MRVRMPQFEFARSTGRWIPKAGEFAHLLNANSVVIPHLERFLNKVMAKAASHISADDAESKRIRADIRTFIKQESCHYTVHGSFNEMLINNGYDRIPELEKRITAHYDRLITTKSLPFLLAYCEGFESLTPPTAENWFNGSMDRMMSDADPAVLAMWRWHLMEEFEHRTVCHDAFKAVHGGNVLRIYGWLYQAASISRMVGWVYRYLLEVDRQQMTTQEIERSKRNAKRSVMGFAAPMVRAAPRILSPGYTPRDLSEPDGWAATRDMIERDYMRDAAAPAAVLRTI
jgi:uncharacterized protein